MASRLELQTVLENILGSQSVYFQPPETVKLIYPCILYSRNRLSAKRANNNLYILDTEYVLTYISKDPDSGVPAALMQLPKCVHDRHYSANGFHHDIFTLFY